MEIGDVCYSAPLSYWGVTPHEWNACDTDGNTSDPEDLAFMSKYGIRRCMTSENGTKDYWAGAVKTCGGVNKMPQIAQAANIASYFYGINIATSGRTYCPQDANGEYTWCRNDNLIESMGFPISVGYANSLTIVLGKEGVPAFSSGFESSMANDITFDHDSAYISHIRRHYGVSNGFTVFLCITD